MQSEERDSYNVAFNHARGQILLLFPMKSIEETLTHGSGDAYANYMRLETLLKTYNISFKFVHLLNNLNIR